MSRKTITLLGALVAARQLSCRARPGRRRRSRTPAELTGAGSTFVSKLVQAWIPKVDSPLGHQGDLRPDRQRRRHHADHQPHGRLRRERRAADPRPVRGVQGLRPDSMGALGDVDRLPARRRCRTSIRLTGPVLANIFLGRIKKWNDPAIRALNKGKSHPGHRHHGHPPVRQQRHDLQHHRVLQQRQPRAGRAVRARASRSTGRPGSAPAASAGVSAALTPDATAASRTSTSRSRSRTSSSSRRSRTAPASYALPGLKGIRPPAGRSCESRPTTAASRS